MNRRTLTGASRTGAARRRSHADAMADAKALVAKYAGQKTRLGRPDHRPDGRRGQDHRRARRRPEERRHPRRHRAASRKRRRRSAGRCACSTAQARSRAAPPPSARRWRCSPTASSSTASTRSSSRPAWSRRKAAGIPMVSWHASPVIGPDPKSGVFANVIDRRDGGLGGGGRLGLRRCRRQAGRGDLHRLDLCDRHRQGRPDEGGDRAAGRHGARICRHADRRHLDPDAAR